MVGVSGFEPETSCAQGKRQNAKYLSLLCLSRILYHGLWGYSAIQRLLPQIVPKFQVTVGIAWDTPRSRCFDVRLLKTYSNRQGERSTQPANACVAHAVGLSVWHEVQGLGILYLSVIEGVMNRKVCE
jgi:hypothetical protein